MHADRSASEVGALTQRPTDFFALFAGQDARVFMSSSMLHKRSSRMLLHRCGAPPRHARSQGSRREAKRVERGGNRR